MKDKGFDLIAINSGDSSDTIRSYVNENGWSFKIAMDQTGIADKYKVEGYPTNYVLDSQGKVVWRGTGFDEDAIRAALSKLGVS